MTLKLCTCLCVLLSNTSIILRQHSCTMYMHFYNPHNMTTLAMIDSYKLVDIPKTDGLSFLWWSVIFIRSGYYLCQWRCTSPITWKWPEPNKARDNLNSLRPSGAYMHQWIMASPVQVIPLASSAPRPYLSQLWLIVNWLLETNVNGIWLLLKQFTYTIINWP